MKFIRVKNKNGNTTYINTSHIAEIVVNNYDEVYIHTENMRIPIRESIEDVFALIGENVKQS